MFALAFLLHDQALQTINWTDLEKALLSYKPFYRTKMAQLMHDWQYTGYRQFLMSEGNAECPCQCGAMETKLHYLSCTSKEVSIGRARLLTLLQNQLKSTNTFPGISTAIGRILTVGYEGDWWNDKQPQNILERKLQITIEKQKDLGETALAKGYMVQEWKDLQSTWESTTNAANSKYNWGRETIISIHSYVYGSWKLRSDVVHGKSEKSKRAKKKQVLQDRVKSLYKRGRANLTLQEKNYFKLPVEQRIKKGTDSLQLWIKIVEGIFQKRGAARQETLDKWMATLREDNDLTQPKAKHKRIPQYGDDPAGGEEVS